MHGHIDPNKSNKQYDNDRGNIRQCTVYSKELGCISKRKLEIVFRIQRIYLPLPLVTR